MLIFDAYDPSKNVFIRDGVHKNLSVIYYSSTLVIKMNLFILTDLEYISGGKDGLQCLIFLGMILI